MMTTLWDWIRCHVFKDHDWTNKAAQGIAPSSDELTGPIDLGFRRYSQMYCAKCGHVSDLNFR